MCGIPNTANYARQSFYDILCVAFLIQQIMCGIPIITIMCGILIAGEFFDLTDFSI